MFALWKAGGFSFSTSVADPNPDPDPRVLGLLDPDLLFRGMDSDRTPDPDPSIIK